ncbi:ribonuclease 1-like [Momordica charantia]|uniref:Ribonuclease 1-like n=1 Tax=Momordica charantia TaxID=3673 RepID=A0A6J1CQQ9_MOMCH|nr:ribonuclease 1-like [Momordica charantia]
MGEYWQDLVSGDNTAAWQTKWAIHGTCSATVFDEFKYFCMGLDTYGRHAILSFLVHGGLVPSSAQLHHKTSFIKAIADVTSKKGGVICAADQRGRTQLKMVVLCYSKDGATMIDCPDNVSSSCPDKFLWLALGD